MLKGTMNKLKIVGIAVIVLIVVIVVLQNTQAVDTKLLFLHGDDAERGPLVRNVDHRFCDRRTNCGAHRVPCEARAAGLSMRRMLARRRPMCRGENRQLVLLPVIGAITRSKLSKGSGFYLIAFA